MKTNSNVPVLRHTHGLGVSLIEEWCAALYFALIGETQDNFVFLFLIGIVFSLSLTFYEFWDSQ